MSILRLPCRPISQFGTYDLQIAMVDSSGNPTIRLPMPDETEKMYKIGAITVASTANSYTAPEPRAQFSIDAQDYTGSDGAYGVYYTPDGGYDALYMEHKGEWAEYDNIDVPMSGMYTVEFRVSAKEANKFRLEIDGVDATGSMKTPDAGGELKFRTMERPINLTAGRHTFKIVNESADKLYVNWMRFTLQHPYDFTIQAESPDHSSDVSLHATKFIDNDGTAGVSVIDTGDWLQYDNIHVPESGPYLLQMRYATPAGSPVQRFKLLVNEVDVSGELSLYDSGGTKRMASQGYIVNLPAGTHSFKVLWTDVESDVIWNWMKWSYQGPFTKTIEAEHYTMQWNVDKEEEWDGPNTGVITETYLDGERSITAACSLHKNDYIRYENIYVPYTGYYFFEFNLSASKQQQFAFEVEGDSTLIEVPDTGGDSHFTTVSTWIKLTEGINNFRIVTNDSPIGSGICFDWFRFTK
ncbi:carbohydrate-binding protein [Paenibacillus sp. IITD108]|uniref:carbohydrate-binding protein n=1 Tax=Paenibacillus sp. IITD108 TaxID=3116649 RepID=UPI002F3F4761